MVVRQGHLFLHDLMKSETQICCSCLTVVTVIRIMSLITSSSKLVYLPWYLFPRMDSRHAKDELSKFLAYITPSSQGL